MRRCAQRLLLSIAYMIPSLWTAAGRWRTSRTHGKRSTCRRSKARRSTMQFQDTGRIWSRRSVLRGSRTTSASIPSMRCRSSPFPDMRQIRRCRTSTGAFSIAVLSSWTRAARLFLRLRVSATRCMCGSTEGLSRSVPDFQLLSSLPFLTAY